MGEDKELAFVEILRRACGPKQTTTSPDPTELSRTNSNQAGQRNNTNNDYKTAISWKDTETHLKRLFSS